MQGVIVSIRPAVGPAAGDVRGGILAAIGSVASTDDHARASSAVEFVVRGDNGRTISVMQPNAERLRVGERVRLQDKPRPGLARLE